MNSENEFITPSINDAAYLAAEGHPPIQCTRAGSVVLFHFSLTGAQADTLLGSARREFARVFSESQLKIKRLIDTTLGRPPRTGRGS